MAQLQIGQNAPLFTASSTEGLIKLADYKGKWVMLVCNPTEFNTWRKNELLSLVKYAKAFADRDVNILTMSMDEKGNHLSWFYGTARLNNYAMPFPIIDDRKGNVGQLYGLKVEGSPRTSTSTEIFIISPEQTIVDQLSFSSLGSTQVHELLKHFDTLQSSYRPQAQGIQTSPDAGLLCPTTPIVGEYVLGNPTNVDSFLLDFVIYAFALINPDGTLTVYSTRYLEELVNLKLENPYLKVILGIGGWGADGFSDAALTPTSRYNFAREAKRWVDQYGLDGVDIDWEYPGSSAAGIKSRPTDRENFTLLLTALRDVLGEAAWISVAGTGSPSYINNVDIQSIAPIINYFNLMAYDFTAGETGPGAARHHSNLFPSDLSLGDQSVSDQITNLEEAGMPSYQILMGIPFYGRYGALETKTFDELRRNFFNKNGYRVLWDNVAKAPYIVDPNGNFAYSFDNLLSIYFKGLYIEENCLGGMFSWQSGMDKANILANAMSQAIRDIEQLKDVLAQAYYVSTQV